MPRAPDAQETERRAFWRHRKFRDLGLLKARFTRHRYDLHTHPTYVIAVITQGCERIRVGKHTVVAPAGTVAVVNPEEWHDGEAGAGGGWAYRTFYPSEALLTEVAHELGHDSAPFFSPAPIRDSALLHALITAHRASISEDATHAEATLLLALRHLILGYGDWRGRDEPFERTGSGRRFSTYEDVIARHLAADLDLQRLAHAAGVTRFQVIRDFKKVTGLTPAAFIRDRRLRRARLLIEHGATLADAAAAAGFADQSHLSRAFRAAHGFTPGMLKRAL